jgi:hypothetical protein
MLLYKEIELPFQVRDTFLAASVGGKGLNHCFIILKARPHGLTFVENEGVFAVFKLNHDFVDFLPYNGSDAVLLGTDLDADE